VEETAKTHLKGAKTREKGRSGKEEVSPIRENKKREEKKEEK